MAPRLFASGSETESKCVFKDNTGTIISMPKIT